MPTRSAVLFLVLASALQAGPAEALRYSNNKNGGAFIVWKNGRIVAESYRHGGAPEQPEHIFSITKNLTALAIFHEVGAGKLRLDEPAAGILTEWQSRPGHRAITIRQLLDQTSGLAPGYGLYAKTVRDKNLAATRASIISPPGEIFSYGPSNYEALGAILSRETRRPLLPWMEDSVLRPLGIQPAGWRKDSRGFPYLSAGARLRARDLLALGQIVRRKGWRGIFPRIPSTLFKQAEKGSPANRMYGMGFWLNRAAAGHAVERDIEEALAAGLSRAEWSRSCLSNGAPPDLVAMAGSQGQRVYVSRSQNLVIVRLGRGGGFRDPDFLRAFFRQ